MLDQSILYNEKYAQLAFTNESSADFRTSAFVQRISRPEEHENQIIVLFRYERRGNIQQRRKLCLAKSVARTLCILPSTSTEQWNPTRSTCAADFMTVARSAYLQLWIVYGSSNQSNARKCVRLKLNKL